MLSKGFLATAALCSGLFSQITAVTLSGYEFIVVGSGPGGGPVAARLAQAGHKTLLIEAGDDQGSNVNYTVPAFEAKITEDNSVAWDFFVRHYTDDTRTKRDFKLTYTTPSGGEYVGPNPPSGSKIKGILYPRAATIGGCAAHNALVSIYPDRSDFQSVVDITGDKSWSPANMRKYFVGIEDAQYIPPGRKGHGYGGWFATDVSPILLAVRDTYLLKMIIGASKALAAMSGGTAQNLASVVAGDANADTAQRDSTPRVYQVPISANEGQRQTVRELLLSVANAKNADGSKKYPLDIRTDCYVTKVVFNSQKKATGVEFLDGKHLYRASPLSGASGTPGSASASREVIVSGGSYNTPQILKLSGIGPAAELKKFNIPVISNLPGVGENLQDHYEVAVQGFMKKDFPALDGCTFGFSQPDPCFDRWQKNIGGNRGVYGSSGFAAMMLIKSNFTPDGNYDELAFGGPVDFRGYFPGYSYNATQYHNRWTWALLKSHPRNTAGYVRLRSANPLDVPDINFNYFDTGTGDYNSDLGAIVTAIKVARDAFAKQATPFTELLPGSNLQTDAQLVQYAKDTAWGHHCSCTAKIGADNDPMAVLDSSFRVRGVTGLRVIDASVWPRIPGTFTLVSTYLIGEKGADVILSQLK